MPEQKTGGDTVVSRDRLAELLNEDLAREYQAIIAYGHFLERGRAHLQLIRSALLIGDDEKKGLAGGNVQFRGDESAPF
jgi:hypothetical protein